MNENIYVIEEPGYYIFKIGNAIHVIHIPKDLSFRSISRPMISYEEAIEYIRQNKIIERHRKKF